MSASDEKRLQAIKRRMQLKLYETNFSADNETFLALLQTNGLKANATCHALYVLIPFANPPLQLNFRFCLSPISWRTQARLFGA